MKSPALRVASSLLVLAFLVSSVPLFATPPPPGPGSPVIQGEIYSLFYQTSGVANAAGLSQGERTSLVAKLIHAVSAVGRGNDKTAISDLGAFTHELDALVQSGRLTPAEAEPLATQADVIAGQIAAASAV